MPGSAGDAVKLAMLVFSLGIDTLSVAVALGISGIGRANRLRVGLSFSLFEGVMPLIGLSLGRVSGSLLGGVASFVGIAALFGVGAWMAYESVWRDEDAPFDIDGWSGLIVTSLSVSLDEFAVGFGIGALGLPIVLAVLCIALQAFVLTIVGTALGNRIGERLAERAEALAGIVLAGLALVLLVQQLRG
jgi:putative Mn2+ efflux pump MntP